MPQPRFPWPMGDKRRGGPLLGPGGPPELFAWNPISGEPLPSGTFTRSSIKLEFDGVDFTELAVNEIPENSAFEGSGPKGYNPEPLATNQMTSINMTGAPWGVGGITPTSNGTNALNLTEYQLDVGIGAGVHRIFANAAVGTDGSCYYILRGTTGRYISVRRGGGAADDYATFDMQAGSITEEGPQINDALLNSLGNAFYKCEVNTFRVGGTILLGASDVSNPGTSDKSFTGANELYFSCHAQYETTLYSTSPIVTSGTVQTRQPDILDSDVVIPSEYGVLLDLTLPDVIESGNIIALIGADTTAEDVLRVDSSFNLIMDDGGTPTIVGAVTPGTRNKVSYGRDATGRSASLNGASVVTAGAPGAGHEGETFQIGCTSNNNQSRSLHHVVNIYDGRPTDGQLEQFSS